MKTQTTEILGWNHSTSNFRKEHAIVSHGTHTPYAHARTLCGARIDEGGALTAQPRNERNACTRCLAKN